MCLKTQKSHRNCTITLGVCSLVFIVMGVVLPIILHNAISEMAKNQVVMTPSSHGLWGEVPGDTKMKIYRTFQFFNFKNPYETLFLNETPAFQESLPYDYQEYQQFLNYSFYMLPNSSLEVVSFNFWDYMHKIERGNASDEMTIANLLAFGAWYQLQNSENFLLSIQTMSQLITGLESQIIDFALSQGILSIFIADKKAAIDRFTTYGISAAKADELWEDVLFGWKNATTMVNWVKATNEGLYNLTSKMLKDYFHLTYTQMSPLLSDLKLNIDSITTLIQNMYCVNQTNLTCDARYLAALQWSQQGITLNPPGGMGKAKSIISTNSTAEGYPEISYFYSDYFLPKICNDTPYQNLTFTVEWAYNLLARSGDPKNWLRSPYLIFHQGNLKFLFKQGTIFDQSGNLTDLEPIRERFLLDDLYHTHVFWRYMIYMVEDFALMTPKNGSRETLGLGAFSSQYLYSAFMEVKDFLLDDITAKCLLANLTDRSMKCEDLFNNSMSGLNDSQLASLCHKEPNLLTLNETAMLFLSDLCLNTYDPIWFDFMERNNLTKINMFELCDTKYGLWGPLMNETNLNIKNHYNCTVDAEYCSANEIAIKQWGQSLITLNPPPSIKGRYYNSSFSVSDWNSTRFPRPIEFLGVLNFTHLNKSKDVSDIDRLGINQTLASSLLTFDCLFNAVMNAKAFLFYINNDFANFTKNFPVNNPLLLLNYLRYVTIEFGFGGITVKKNVSDLLLGYEVPFVKMMKDTDPAMGGNPSINPKVGFCPNNTPGDAEFNTQVMYTGNGDHTLVRKYYSVYGSQNMVQWIADFNGNDTTNITKNPYNDLVPLQGTDGFTDRPNLDPNGDSFEVYVTMLMRYGTTHGMTTSRDFNGLKAYLYRMDNSLMNKNSVFNQNRWNGFLNFSSIMSAPVFNSKRHFLDADDEIIHFINLTDVKGEVIVPNRDDDDIYLYVEPYTGLSLSAWLKLQTSVELNNNLLFNSTYAMLPIFCIQRGGDIPDSVVDDLLGQLKLGILFETILSRVICFVIGGVLFLVTAILAYKYYKKAKKNRKEGKLLDKNSTQI